MAFKRKEKRKKNNKWNGPRKFRNFYTTYIFGLLKVGMDTDKTEGRLYPYFWDL